MLESFLGEDVFRDGIRQYIAAHKYSNTTTADLWNALSEASGKPVGEIAAGWTEQPGFPVVKVKREADGKVRLTQERFTVNFKNAPPLLWKIPADLFGRWRNTGDFVDDRQDGGIWKTFPQIARSN